MSEEILYFHGLRAFPSTDAAGYLERFETSLLRGPREANGRIKAQQNGETRLYSSAKSEPIRIDAGKLSLVRGRAALLA
ncbi:MAG: hypothetical protein AAFW59_05815 [Pseudomonadota bacterium]